MGKPAETALCPGGWVMDITDSALDAGGDAYGSYRG